MNGDGDGDGAGMGTGVEAIERTQDGNGDGSGDGAGTGTELEARRQTQDGNGNGSEGGNESSSGDGDGIEDGIGEGGGEGTKPNKSHKICRRDEGNEGDLGVKIKKPRQEGVGSVAADPDNLENSKKAGREARGTQGLGKNYLSTESVPPLSRLIRGVRNEYH